MTTADLGYFKDAGVYDPAAPDAANVERLLDWLLGLGWAPEDIVAGAATKDLESMAAEHVFRPKVLLTLDEAAARLGLSVDRLDELRRTAGLAPRGIDGPGFSEADIEGFKRLAVGASMFTEEEANHFARVLGSSLARIADAAVSLFLIDVEGPLRQSGGSEYEVARRNLDAIQALDAVAAALDPLLRLHMEDAIERSRAARDLDDSAHLVRMAVGFVDLVGFTAFSEQVSAAELGLLVRQFEDAAYDLVADHGGRVVKLIGDEVMFVTVDPQVALTIAMGLISEFRGGSVTPRGGLAYGELLSRGGDYYGPIVNLAARIGDLAVPCELLATPELASHCPEYSFEPAGRRQLKGFAEPVPLVSLSC